MFQYEANCYLSVTIENKTQQEQERLSKYIGYNINEVYIDFGKEGVHKKDYKGYKKVTFTTKKLGVKCKYQLGNFSIQYSLFILDLLYRKVVICWSVHRN